MRDLKTWRPKLKLFKINFQNYLKKLLRKERTTHQPTFMKLWSSTIGRDPTMKSTNHPLRDWSVWKTQLLSIVKLYKTLFNSLSSTPLLIVHLLVVLILSSPMVESWTMEWLIRICKSSLIRYLIRKSLFIERLKKEVSANRTFITNTQLRSPPRWPSVPTLRSWRKSERGFLKNLEKTLDPSTQMIISRRLWRTTRSNVQLRRCWQRSASSLLTSKINQSSKSKLPKLLLSTQMQQPIYFIVPMQQVQTKSKRSPLINFLREESLSLKWKNLTFKCLREKYLITWEEIISDLQR